MGLLNEYTIEKSNLKKIFIGSRMTEVSYNETFNLIFRQIFYKDTCEEMQFVLTIDAPCWFGNRDELTRIRYNNLIKVNKVEFLDDFLSITFPGENILSIAYHSESDYAWILEEVGQKLEQERMMKCCQENELYKNNI